MRRKDKEITRRDEIEAIIRQASVCRLAMVDDGRPYLVPLCFGYEDETLYFHSAGEGRKLAVLRRNPAVCFEFEGPVEVKRGEDLCSWGMRFQSVIGSGRASFIETPEAKRHALAVIVRQYGADGPWTFADTPLARTVVFKVEIQELTGKQAG